MAARLTDVDAVIGGDSHSLLGDFSAIGLAGSEGGYPTIATNKDGEQVCIGQAWEYNKAIGEMQLKFDTRGRISSCTGQASLVVAGTSFKRANAQGANPSCQSARRQSNCGDRFGGICETGCCEKS
jgi:5'-nucleotidase